MTRLTSKGQKRPVALGESCFSTDKGVAFPGAKSGPCRRELDCLARGKWIYFDNKLTPKRACGEWTAGSPGRGINLRGVQVEVSSVRNPEELMRHTRGSQSQRATVPAALPPVPLPLVSLLPGPNPGEARVSSSWGRRWNKNERRNCSFLTSCRFLSPKQAQAVE